MFIDLFINKILGYFFGKKNSSEGHLFNLKFCIKIYVFFN